jgi:hypothetical protein
VPISLYDGVFTVTKLEILVFQNSSIERFLDIDSFVNKVFFTQIRRKILFFRIKKSCPRGMLFISKPLGQLLLKYRQSHNNHRQEQYRYIVNGIKKIHLSPFHIILHKKSAYTYS